MAPPLLPLQNVALTFGGTPLITERRALGLAGRAGLPRRPQRLGQVDAAQDRRRSRRGRPRHALRAARRDRPLSGPGAGSPAMPRRRSPMWRRASAPGDDPYRARYLLEQLGLTGDEEPATSPAARRAARRSPRCWRRSPTSCCSTSRRTISTCRRSNGWRRAEAALGPRAHQPRPPLPGEPLPGDDLARPRHDPPDGARLRRLRGLARRGAGAGGARAAQARPQARRRGRLAALRRHGPAQAQRAPPRQPACHARAAPRPDPRRRHRLDDAERRGEQSGTLVVEAEGVSSPSAPRRSCATSRCASCAATARHRRPERRRQDDAPQSPHRRARAR